MGSKFCKKCGLTGKESCAYAMSLHTRNPVIKTGDSFEVEVYLTGYGVPKDNKLLIHYTTRGFIDPKDPGYVEVGGKQVEESGKGLFKFGDEYKTKHECEQVGVQISFPPTFFRTKHEYFE